jgi:hypothetical protein
MESLRKLGITFASTIKELKVYLNLYSKEALIRGFRKKGRQGISPNKYRLPYAGL